jgi:dipeptidyl aminopeptidase/acylaminoacyl peptidase
MQRPTPTALVTTQAAIESFSVSPSGELVAYALRTVVGGAYRSHIWVVPRAGGRPRALTRGAVRDAAPAFSPDGSRVAFARRPAGETEEKAQVWTVPAGGGRLRRLTRQREGASTPLWSPDGRTIAFIGEAGDDRFAVGLDPRRRKRAPTARRITRLDYRDDTSGWLGRRSHLWLIPADGRGPATQLTHGDFDVTHPAWRPDGAAIAFAADRGPDANIAPRTEILSVSVPGGAMGGLAALAGDADRPAWSPDGSLLAFIGSDVADPPDDALVRLWVQSSGAHAPRALTADLDRSVGIEAWADLVVAEDGPGPVWLSDAEVAVVISDRGRNLPHRVSLTGEVAPLVEPGRLVTASIAAAGGRLTICAGDDGSAPELFAFEDGRLRRLTGNGSRWQRRFPSPRLEELRVDGPGGPIQVWLASPASAGDGPLATILLPHGGPSGSHAPGGRMDTLLLCGAGYRVAMPNIRGSTSFGAAWLGALGGRWGDVDAADALAVMDHLVAADLADPGRLGVMGLSYAGYLTQWLIGVTDRFAAAVAENGVANQVSTWGNSYFGVHYNRRASLGDPLTPEGVDRLWATSPLRNVARVRTPLLMLQAEEDRNCPAADNEQLFAALKVLGREVEYIVYPEEHHGFKDDGRPDRRIDRMERILAWFERWMPAG